VAILKNTKAELLNELYAQPEIAVAAGDFVISGGRKNSFGLLG